MNYHSRLEEKAGYHIVQVNTRDNNTCWGVSIVEKKILLYNVSKVSQRGIELMLEQADMQYKTEWMK
jgi:hypothetical protein